MFKICGERPTRAGKRLFAGGSRAGARWRWRLFLSGLGSPGPLAAATRRSSCPARRSSGRASWRSRRDGTLADAHADVTLAEILAGLTLGLTVATVIGYGLAKSPLLERILSPYIVASQAVPIVALAPLLVIWFGFGGLSKVLVCALTVFFPGAGQHDHRHPLGGAGPARADALAAGQPLADVRHAGGARGAARACSAG